ncbi:unnamed protein product [Mytilus coruscus]|uniref:Uncharacterized protein n=1 Tax=Mytilus coruscus TaxID=42192 RepID=A0A6J8ACI0_MYTCO|nr:unnamed protein product [Mytilus coruscus]
MDFVASKSANLPIVVEDVKAISPLSDVPNVLPRQNNNPIQHPSPTPETSNYVTHQSHTWKSVVTPICSKTLKILLMGYPYQDANYLVSGFEEGFRLGYEGPREQRMSNNLQSAYQLPDVVDKKLSKEVSLGIIAGPFSEIPFKNLQVSPIGGRSI